MANFHIEIGDVSSESITLSQFLVKTARKFKSWHDLEIL